MIRPFSHFVSSRTTLLLVVNLLVLILAACMGIGLQSIVHLGHLPVINSSAPPEASGFAFLMLFILCALGVCKLDLYERRSASLTHALIAFVIGFVVAGAAPYVLDQAREFESVNTALTLLVATLGSSLVPFGFCQDRCQTFFKRRVAVLGSGSLAARFAESARGNKVHEVVGYLGPPPSGKDAPPLRAIPTVPGESLVSVAERCRIDEIVVAVRDRRTGGIPMGDLLECKLAGVMITDLPDFVEREYRQVLVESINPSWMIFGDGFNQGWTRNLIKNAFDLLASLILLILTLPIMLVTALCILLEDGGPVLYRQARVGLNGRVFNIFKFRSMRTDAEKDGRPRWAATEDARVTRVGKVIRKLRIDELPQIVNVLRGEMAFVGPRPERPYFVDKLAAQIPYYQTRHSVKPGITGWAQVRHAYGASIKDTVEKLQYDLYYVKNHSLLLDLMTLVATVEVVLFSKGAR